MGQRKTNRGRTSTRRLGPIVGSLCLTPFLAGCWFASDKPALGIDIPGAKQVFYGICLLAVIMALPDGVWPWLRKRIGLTERDK